MNFNPFDEKPLPIEKTFLNWRALHPKSYLKETIDPTTKRRILLMNSIEFEAGWFNQNYSKHCLNRQTQSELALSRRIEQQQQKRISSLIPMSETSLETTIAYHHMAVDLTGILIVQEPDKTVKSVLQTTLAEDINHLCCYQMLYQLENQNESCPVSPMLTAKKSEHRHPADTLLQAIDFIAAQTVTKLNLITIAAVKQQIMNFGMNTYPLTCNSDIGRRLYQEILMFEEQHVSQYDSLKDPAVTWPENLLLHEYNECYLYYSCMMTESNIHIKRIWEECLIQEIAQLHQAKKLLEEQMHRDYREVIPCGDIEKPLSFNISHKDDLNEANYLPLTEEPANKPGTAKYHEMIRFDIRHSASCEIIEKYVNQIV